MNEATVTRRAMLKKLGLGAAAALSVSRGLAAARKPPARPNVLFVAVDDMRDWTVGLGGEELYDHQSDPNEWTNLASRGRHRAVIADLARWIPKRFAPHAPSKNAYRFDPKTYSWVHKKTGKKTLGK